MPCLSRIRDNQSYTEKRLIPIFTKEPPNTSCSKEYFGIIFFISLKVIYKKFGIIFFCSYVFIIFLTILFARFSFSHKK